jgi:hypothetical protein
MAIETKKEKEGKKFTEVMSHDLAASEVERWLDYKQIDDLQREDQEGSIKYLISYIKSGHLILNEDYSFTHRLKFPLDSAGLTILNYKSRVMEKELSSKLMGVRADDTDGRIVAHISALTGQVIGIIKSLDKEDIKIARSIAVFFM